MNDVSIIVSVGHINTGKGKPSVNPCRITNQLLELPDSSTSMFTINKSLHDHTRSCSIYKVL